MAIESRNPTNLGVEARGRERLMADLNGHASHAGLDDGGAGIVIGPGEGYRHNGNGRLYNQAETPSGSSGASPRHQVMPVPASAERNTGTSCGCRAESPAAETTARASDGTHDAKPGQPGTGASGSALACSVCGPQITPVILADPASQAIAANTTPGRKPSDLEPLSGEPALGELQRQEFLRRRPRYSSSPGVDAARAKQSRTDLTVALLRAMVPDEVADQSEFPPIRELVADIRRRIVELDPACCPVCFHERSADKAHDPEGEPLYGKYEIACEHCDHREIVKRSTENDD